MNKIKIGWAEIDITPDKMVSLAGQFAERISEYVEKPITATALAIEVGDEQVVMVSCDLVGVPAGLLAGIRENLVGNTVGLDPMKTVFSATHIHTGPNFARGSKLNKLAGVTSSQLLEEAMP